MKYKKTIFSNGLRVITVPTKGLPSVTVMVLVETGSHYESKKESGLSHFLEHMVFKGTKKRPTFLDIGRELEEIGAVSNAATSNECTYYYAKAEKKYFAKLIDVVSDLYLNPSLPISTLENERGVILQELSMYEDKPQQKVWEVLSELLYGDVPAGRPIIGSRENIKRFKREDFVNYHKAHYVASKTVVIVAGDVSDKKIVSEVKKRFKNISEGKKILNSGIEERQRFPAIKILKKKTDQAHLVIAFRSFGAKDRRNYALTLLAYILGKGFSSRLFHKIREEMGASYYIRASAGKSTDHGIFAISAGVEVSRLGEVVVAILGECLKLKRRAVDEAELNKAKEYCLGKMYMELETSDSLADFYSIQEVLTRNLITPSEFEKRIRKIRASDIIKVAGEVFRNDKLNLAVVGDIRDMARIKKVLSLK
jgi:predicted Zn-dependent peptidase